MLWTMLEGAAEKEKEKKRKERLLGGCAGRNTPSRPGCVSVEGDRPDGERDVSVPGGYLEGGLNVDSAILEEMTSLVLAHTQLTFSCR